MLYYFSIKKEFLHSIIVLHLIIDAVYDQQYAKIVPPESESITPHIKACTS